MNKYILFLSLLFCFSSLFTQNDSLNKLDSNKRKVGYWLKYLDLDFVEADSANAYFCCYVYYDKGKAIFTPGKNWRVKGLTIRPENKVIKKGQAVLLNGTMMRYDGADSLAKTLEIYKNGYPLTLTSYHHCQFHQHGISEFLDFTKSYQNQKGSYYYETHDAYQTKIKKYWYRKDKRRWKFHRIQD